MAALALVEPMIGNIEAEMAVIGASLCEAKIIDAIADRLRPEHFADKFLGHVWSLILREHSLGRPPSPFTMRPLLEPEPGFQDVGGWPWLAELTSARVAVIVAQSSASQIIEFAQRRRLIEGMREAIAKAGDFDAPIADVIEAADDALSAARDEQETRGEYSGGDCIQLVIDDFDRPISGVTCGCILSVDQLLGPLRPTHLTIGAGRPGMGKTATALSYSLGAAGKGHGVLFLSLEMSAKDLGERAAADLCLEHRIPHEKIRDRSLTIDQKREVCRAKARLEAMPLQIVDRTGVSIAQLRSIVRRWVRRFAARGHRLELVIVDYLQLMRGPGKDRYEQITNISQGLKEIAKENNLAVLALSQLSRKVEERADKRPNLADLRESGQIEQDADAVLFFLRQEYYLRNAEPPADPEKRAKWERALDDAAGRIEFICAKRRHGTTGALKGEFLYHYQAVRG